MDQSHQIDYPSKRLKPNDVDVDDDDTDEQQLPHEQPPIYSGPGVGCGYSYFCYEGIRVPPSQAYSHTIFFKGDKFTVREDRHLLIPDEDKHIRVKDDTRIRHVWDSQNREFLESLGKDQCPAELSKDRPGHHHVTMYGLGDKQNLIEPSTPPDVDHEDNLPDLYW